MTRPALWCLVLATLLVASNAAWLLLRGSAPAEPLTTASAEPQLRARVAELERDLAAAQARRDAAATSRRTAPESRTAAPPPDAHAAAVRQRQASEQQRALALAKEWTEAALQITDPARRQTAIETIRAALQRGDDVASVQAALLALARIRELAYDKESFRDLVLPCLAAPDPHVRASALFALFNTAPRAEDVPRLLALAGDPAPEVRERLAHALCLFTKGELAGETAEVVVRLFDDASPQVRRGTMASLWGSRVTPEIEGKYLELLANPATRQDAIYFGFSTFREKSPRAVQVLIEAAAGGDGQTAERARWGLGHGVPRDSQRAVADAFVQLLQTRAQGHEQCLRVLQQYADASHLPALEVFAANQQLPAQTREHAQSVIAAMRQR